MAKSKKEMLPISELTEKQLELRNITEFILNQMGTTILKVFIKNRKTQYVIIRHSIFALLDKYYCQLPDGNKDHVNLKEVADIFGYNHTMLLEVRGKMQGLTDKNDKSLHDVWTKVLELFPIAKQKIYIEEYQGYHLKKNIENKIYINDYKKHIPNIFDTIKEAKSFIDGYNFCNNKLHLSNNNSFAI